MTPTLLIFILRFAGPIIGGCLAMITDIRQRRIPNWLSVSLLVVGILFRISVAGGYGLLDALGGAATGFGVLFALYLIGGGGAGDVKFMTAVGAWIGAYHLVFVFVLSAILLACFTLVWLAVKLIGRKSNQRRDDQGTERQGNPLRAQIPYAVPVTLALAIRLLWLIAIGRDS